MTTPTHPTTAREALAAVGITNPEQLTRTNGVGWDFDQPATITPAFDTGDDLNDRMDFDHVIEVTEDGDIIDRPETYEEADRG